ncbi:MAG: malto-oligosyltrehalose synthase [Acidobacteriota bacterium]
MTDEAAGLSVETLARRVAESLEVPSSTYRLQLGPWLTFAGAEALAPYLSSLGVGAVYLSPCLQSRTGSAHGYDVVDYGALDKSLGGAAAFEAMARAFRERGMGVMLDFVPNHMRVDPVENRAWRDVLENGPSALSAEWFDIDWHPVKAALHDRVLLPILGDQYGAVLERGELAVALVGGVFELRYFEHRLPLNPRHIPLVFARVLQDVEGCGAGPDEVRELRSILTAFGNLPIYTERTAERREERRRETEVAYARLSRLLDRSAPIATFVATAVADINGQPGRPESFDQLHTLIERQPYRLAYWRSAFDEINYRRFFDINELGAVRMEDPRVFEEAHRIVLDLVARGLVTGLRLDHPDGLWDPEEYFERLQASVWRARVARALGGASDERVASVADWRARVRAADDRHWAARPLYVVAEKILSSDEQFPSAWAIHGGTGYRFLNQVNGLFIDRAGLHHIQRQWSRLIGRDTPFEEIAYECRRLVAQASMASEMNVLAHALEDIAGADRRTRDFTLNSLRKVLREVVASFPVYRTYVSPRGVSDTDRAVIRHAVSEARRRSPVMEPSIFDFVERVLTADAATSAAHLQFAMRLQQFTGPVQAKGLEDTAFYRYVPLLAANEVGSHPAEPSLSVDQFHQANLARLADWPATMTTLATHDTKRSGDARARLAALSERPAEWRRAVADWMRTNARHRIALGGVPAPDRADEYHLYQALLAIWPAEAEGAPVPATAPPAVVDRLAAYLVKAVREAKARSSWLRPDTAYEQALVGFAEAITRGPGARRFLDRFVPFARVIARHGALNALAELLLQLASPGVPDVYQGSEDWQLRLVDPDNRAAVNFAPLAARLAELDPWLVRAAGDGGDAEVADFVAGLAAAWPDGRIKTWALAAGLRHRRHDHELFLAGRYVPLACDPPDLPLVALARMAGARALVVAVPRLWGTLSRDGTWPLAGAWGAGSVVLPDELPVGPWRDRLTGRQLHASRGPDGTSRLAIAELFATLPAVWLQSPEPRAYFRARSASAAM